MTSPREGGKGSADGLRRKANSRRNTAIHNLTPPGHSLPASNNLSAIMFPCHGASPREHRLSAAPITSTLNPGAPVSHIQTHNTNNNADGSKQQGQMRGNIARWWGWLRGNGSRGRAGDAAATGTASAVPPAAATATGTAVAALVRGAGAVGLVYGGLWLLLAGYRAVKVLLLRRALREIVPALQQVILRWWGEGARGRVCGLGSVDSNVSRMEELGSGRVALWGDDE